MLSAINVSFIKDDKIESEAKVELWPGQPLIGQCSGDWGV